MSKKIMVKFAKELVKHFYPDAHEKVVNGPMVFIVSKDYQHSNAPRRDPMNANLAWIKSAEWIESHLAHQGRLDSKLYLKIQHWKCHGAVNPKLGWAFAE